MIDVLSILILFRSKVFIVIILSKKVSLLFYVFIFDFITHFRFISLIHNFLFVPGNGYNCFCFAPYFIIQQQILTTINNAIVINKNISKIHKFVGIAYVSSLYDSIISLHVIAESSLYLLNMFHVYYYKQNDSKHNVFDVHDAFHTPINYISFHQIYIYMIHTLLMFLLHLFLWSCWTSFDLNFLFYLEHIPY